MSDQKRDHSSYDFLYFIASCAGKRTLGYLVMAGTENPPNCLGAFGANFNPVLIAVLICSQNIELVAFPAQVQLLANWEGLERVEALTGGPLETSP